MNNMIVMAWSLIMFIPRKAKTPCPKTTGCFARYCSAHYSSMLRLSEDNELQETYFGIVIRQSNKRVGYLANEFLPNAKTQGS
jgi:hypothetical protein